MNSDNIKIKLRRDLSSRWTSLNPVLLQGEPGFERDTGRLKIGNGVLPWTQLPYFVPQVTSPSGPSRPSSGDLAEVDANLVEHVNSDDPHPIYDDGRSFFLLYENAKV